MAGVSSELVRQLNQRAQQARTMAEAALHNVGVVNSNEQLTRRRVVAIEAWCGDFSRLTLWQRLRWLFLGAAALPVHDYAAPETPMVEAPAEPSTPSTGPH